jgi:hypothetical protein
MIENGFDIDITANSVDVRREDATSDSVGQRLLPMVFFTLIAIFLFWAMMFGSKHGESSVWETLSSRASNSGDFQSAAVFAFFAALICLFIFLIGIRMLFPLGNKLHCDRSTFTVSKIPWKNLHGKWTTSSYPLGEISLVKFGIVYGGRATTNALRFNAAGKTQKLFTGIQAPEANKILIGLRDLGVDVPHDPDLKKKVDDTLRERSMSLGNRSDITD